MLTTYLKRGVTAGVVAGIAYGVYMVLVGNPLTSYVDAVAHDSVGQTGPDHSVGVVSETTTAVVSAGSGILWAILLGGAFAVVLYFLEPALPGRQATKSYVLAGAGFLTVSGIPWLALPPAAPGARYAAGIDTRITLYLGFVLLGAVTAAVTVLAYKRVARRHLGVGIVAAVVPICVVGSILSIVVPTMTTHSTVPTDLAVAYRGLAIVSQAGVWLLIATAYNGLRRRASVDDTSIGVETRGTTHQ